MKRILGILEAYGFECKAGTLENCTDWQDLKELADMLDSPTEQMYEAGINYLKDKNTAWSVKDLFVAMFEAARVTLC